jgi:hypothetical protein
MHSCQTHSQQETLQLRHDLGDPEPEDDYDAPPPWEAWDDWDFRAYMEKRRAAETQHAAWLRRQAAAGAHAHLNVSPMTDSRLRANWLALTGGREPHRPTHEEFMDVSCFPCPWGIGKRAVQS